MTPTADQAPTQARRKTRGFSLLELLVAMMIIAVLGTLGYSQYRKHAAQARYLKAKDDLRIVAEGLDQYHLKYGRYPDFGSWDAMVDANSPLLKESLIKVGMPSQDPFHQPYEGKSTRGTYDLKCQGDPDHLDEFGPISWNPGQGISEGSKAAVGTGGTKADVPAGGGSKK